MRRENEEERVRGRERRGIVAKDKIYIQNIWEEKFGKLDIEVSKNHKQESHMLNVTV